MFNQILKIKRKISNGMFVRRHESEYEGVKFMFLNKHTDILLVIFSAFTGENRRYNYFTKFRDLNISQLYILDTWGVTGSYYWYENGFDFPEKKVSALIDYIKKTKGIKRIITAGTSKGGSAAIYFGLKHNAESVYSGACQYRVGTYLNRPQHTKILQGMMGPMDTDKAISLLDKKIETIIRSSTRIDGIINLFYSTKELTYERQIAPLIKDLDEMKCSYSKDINDFPKHDDVGIYFPEYLIKKLNVIVQ